MADSRKQGTPTPTPARFARMLLLLGPLAMLGQFPAVATAAGEPAGANPWVVDVFYENDTHSRRDVGLAKFRNTLQMEADKKLGATGPFSSLGFNVKLRGTFDAVYRMNDLRFGNRAGGPVSLENGVPGQDYSALFGAPPGTLLGTGPVPHGEAPIALFNSGNMLLNNPNDGMVVLGSQLHDTDGGVAFGVPVRPCDTDSRGCLRDYMDASLQELESPEFNDRLDFLRELYFAGTVPLSDGKSLFLKIGKQQVIWGRTDLFRVLDVINPIDYSRNNIYDEMQDIRIPMWIAQFEYRMGASESFQDRNFQVVWNFDKFRPHNLGQCGSPNVILDAGCFFRGMKNLWDNGGTVANFAGAGAINGTPGLATTFGPNQIGIRDVNLPGWSLDNTQLGLKFEGVTKDALSFSVNFLTYRSQLPSLRGGITSVHPFTGATGTFPYLIAFDLDFPRVNLLGGSLDIQADAIGSVIRMEAAITKGEEFPSTMQPRLFKESKVVRYVIGLDRPTFIPLLNKDRTFLISGQIFGQHLLDHEQADGPLGRIGMPDWKDNWIGTLLVKGWYQNDRLSPQLLMAYDVRAQAGAVAPSVEWLVTDNLKLTFGANIKAGTGARKFDDDRTANPFPGFTGPPGEATMSAGLGGYEPLGRFRSGPIGMAINEDFVQFALRYKF